MCKLCTLAGDSNYVNNGEVMLVLLLLLLQLLLLLLFFTLNIEELKIKN